MWKRSKAVSASSLRFCRTAQYAVTRCPMSQANAKLIRVAARLSNCGCRKLRLAWKVSSKCPGNNVTCPCHCKPLPNFDTDVADSLRFSPPMTFSRTTVKGLPCICQDRDTSGYCANRKVRFAIPIEIANCQRVAAVMLALDLLLAQQDHYRQRETCHPAQNPRNPAPMFRLVRHNRTPVRRQFPSPT